MLMLVLAGTGLSLVAAAWALGQCPLARAIGLSMACFAEASRGEADALR